MLSKNVWFIYLIFELRNPIIDIGSWIAALQQVALALRSASAILMSSEPHFWDLQKVSPILMLAESDQPTNNMSVST